MGIWSDYTVLGLYDNKLLFHKGKLSDNQLFLEFEFTVDNQSMEEIEHQARHKAAQLGKNFKKFGQLLNQCPDIPIWYRNLPLP